MIVVNEEEYKYGFSDEIKAVFEIEKGLSKEKIIEISKYKEEPKWLLDFRLKSYDNFLKLSQPKFGPSLEDIDFDDINYYFKASESVSDSWDKVPGKIKDTFGKIGVIDAEKNFLSGVAGQYESEIVYHNLEKDLEKQGVIFLDTETAIKKYPDLYKEYFGTLVSNNDNKYAALNSAVFSGGTFIYVPKGVKLKKPLHSYFRMNSEKFGQFERTLIIVDEDAEVSYIEGCTAPTYSTNSLHAAVVEIFVHKNAKCRYSAIQNWSNNVYNLVTKRAIAHENANMEWIDGNIGSKVNMKYPAIILKGDYSKGTVISVALSSKGQIQDAGCKMIHLGNYTTSNIISKSISKNGGNSIYRGLVFHDEKAKYAKSTIECDTLILDEESRSDTIPINIIKNGTSTIEHEAKVSRINEDLLFYLMSRGFTAEAANELVITGFIEPFARELPMEYAVELNELLKMEMEGSLG